MGCRRGGMISVEHTTLNAVFMVFVIKQKTKSIQLSLLNKGSIHNYLGRNNLFFYLSTRRNMYFSKSELKGNQNSVSN